MNRKLNNLLLAVRKNPSDKKALDTLASAIHQLLITSIKYHGIRETEDAKDLAQEKCTSVLNHLLAGSIETGKEEAYVFRSGRYAAMDFLRQKKRQGTKSHFDEKNPGRRVILTNIDENEVKDGKREILLQVLKDPKMPVAYREALQKRYIDAVPLETLIDEELKRSPMDSHGCPLSRKQARNAVDQVLSRARRWVKERVRQRFDSSEE